MKKKLLFFIYILLLFSMLILPTTAKYMSITYGDIFHVNFTKLTVFAEEFVIQDTSWKKDDNGNSYAESNPLWGTNVPNSGACKLEDLKNVAFSVRNGTKNQIALSSFTISIFLFKNTDSVLTIELTNTASSGGICNIVGTVNINKGVVTSNNFSVTNDNKADGNLHRYTFSIDPLDYYKTVVVDETSSNKWWLTNDEEATLSPYEEANLVKYFVINPGSVSEYNVNISNIDGNNSGDKSYYPEVKMFARPYNL